MSNIGSVVIKDFHKVVSNFEKLVDSKLDSQIMLIVTDLVSFSK